MIAVAWTLLSIFVAPLFAQDEVPAKPKAKPKAAAPADRPVRGTGIQKAVNLAPPEDPVVEALLGSNPTAPADLFRTAQTLVQAGRPELAKGFLAKLLAAKLDDGQWIALVDEFHTPAFTELASRSELRPECEDLVQAALGAVNRRLQDPARLAQQIKQLQDPLPDVRAQAMKNLQGAHEVAVSALIAVLADPTRASEHPVVRSALAAMRGDAIDPLAEILDRADPDLMIQAIDALAEMKAAKATAYIMAPALSEDSDVKVRGPARAALVRLLGTLPSKAQAAQQVNELARSYFAGKESMRTDFDGRVTLWSWDADAKQCVSRNCSLEDASRVMAARLARNARSLAPENRQAQILATAAALEQTVFENGLDKRLDFSKNATIREAATLDPRIIEGVLGFALAENHPASARAAAEILGRIGKSQSLLRSSGEPSPLVRAVRSPDRRLRMAAVEAIARLQPNAPFAGSSHVLEALTYSAATTGMRRALMVSPNSETLEQWIGILKFRKIESDTATSGRDALQMALRCPDYELVAIDMATQGPPAEEIVQQLRRDYRTAGLRVALVARAGFFERGERVAGNDSLSRSFARPHDFETARSQWTQLMAVASPGFVGPLERLDMAARSLSCLATLASTSSKIYDLRRAQDAVINGLLVPGLAGRIAAVLANVGTFESQRSLLDLASRKVEPLTDRQAAAFAFNINVRKFGLLVDEATIGMQYRRYQQSSTQDRATQQLLASILDAIESRATASMLAAAKKGSQPIEVAQPKRLEPLPVSPVAKPNKNK